MSFFVSIITSACGGGGGDTTNSANYYLPQQITNNNQQYSYNYYGEEQDPDPSPTPDSSPTPAKYPLELSQTEFTLSVGDTDNITVRLNGEDITETATYKVEPEAIARVEKGLITALSVGVATVTVQADNAEEDKTFTVNVIKPTLEVSKSRLFLILGGSEDIKDITVTLKGRPVTEGLRYNVKDPEVAKLENGKITAVNKGSTTVTVSLENGGANSALFTVETVGKGDYIEVGRYQQTTEGGDQTPIKWLILDIDTDNNRALILSRYGLERKRFDDDSHVWKDSEMCRWLNDNFYNVAFNKTEKGKIIPVNIVFGDYGSDYYDFNGSNYNVFLLSKAEAERLLTNEARKCKPTDYAVKQEVAVVNGCSAWFVRSPSINNYDNWSIYTVEPDGSTTSVRLVNNSNCVARPALWIKLE